VTGCLFQNNNTNNSGGGAGLNNSSAVFRRCDFLGNSATWGGGAAYMYNAAATFAQCVFDSNTSAHMGGGLHANQAGSAVVVDSCTFYGNEGSPGAAAYARNGGAVNLANSIVAFNPVGTALGCGGTGQMTIVCSDLFGNTGGDGLACATTSPTDGNVFVDPWFCAAAGGDFSLQAHSPCLPANNTCGVNMGAVGQGCGAASPVPGEVVPSRNHLAANVPNPFNPRTLISFGLMAPARTTLVVYDLSGRKVRTLLVNEDLAAGVHRYDWFGRDDNGR